MPLHYYWTKYLRKSILLAALVLSIFLIKIPPFYFLGIKSSLLTTHTLSRFIIFFLFLFLSAKAWLERKDVFSREARTLVVLFLIYFLLQSISVLAVVDAGGFARVYKDIVFAGFFLFVALFEKKFIRSLIRVFILASIVNFFYQMVILWFPQAFAVFGERFVYAPHLELVNINIQRGRLFVETYDEIAIPFVLLLLSSARKTKSKLFFLSLLAAIIIPGLLSNFRTRILMLVFSLGASFFLILKTSKKVKIALLGGVLVLGALTHIVSSAIFGFSYLSRVALENQEEDVSPIGGRLENFKNAVAMGLSRPFSGVGLGGYSLYIPEGRKSVFSLGLNPFRKKQAEIASTNPHNIFAQTLSETGLISLVFFLFVLGVFLKGDLRIVKQGDKERVALVISFWTLFAYSVFNPSTTLGYNGLFWILRAALIQPTQPQNRGSRSLG